MSMMMGPEAPPGLPTPPGGGEAMMGGPAPPMDALSGAPLPGEGGMEALLGALGGGGAGAPPPGIAEEEAAPDEEMDSIGHIQQAMKHLMMAMAKDEDEERGLGITKGMGALQGILAGDQKKNATLNSLG
jgi:hypothetical protein